MTTSTCPTLPVLLRRAMARQGSDVHVTTAHPPRIRIHGGLEPQDDLPMLTAADTARLAYSVLSEAQRAQFEATHELDLAFEVEGVGRVRGNLFRQRGTVGAVYRLVPPVLETLDELGLPAAVAERTACRRGLVLVTGPAGSGKSTTLAAMVDRINRERSGHIVTIEDPIEHVHPHRRCVVTQREVSTDTLSFAAALRAVLRQDPDVVLIGEMRDRETIEAALRVAETGHLTLTTLHTNSAVQTITRIVDVFPASRHRQIRTQLSLVLEGVICQTLVPTLDGAGRVCATEVMVPTPAIRHLIREDKLAHIASAMETGRGPTGMQTMSQSLADWYHRGRISRDQALAHASDRERLRALIGEPLSGDAGRPPGAASGPCDAPPAGRGGR